MFLIMDKLSRGVKSPLLFYILHTKDKNKKGENAMPDPTPPQNAITL